MTNSKIVLKPVDQAMFDNLNGEGTGKRKSEELFFTSYSYFIKEGMHKYALSEDEAFDAYSDSVLAALDKLNKGLFEGAGNRPVAMARRAMRFHPHGSSGADLVSVHSLSIHEARR